MKMFLTQFEFACELFGYEKAISLDKSYIDNFYKDWKSTTYSVKQYKRLLVSRG
jgi:hypothetical protein